MKYVFGFFCLVCSVANGTSTIRYSCLNGFGVHGSEMSVELGTWNTPGIVKFNNSFANEFEWKGGESKLSTNDVLSEMESFGSLKEIKGGEFLKGAHYFVMLDGQEDAGKTDRIYIENKILDGHVDSGLVVYTRVTEEGAETQRAAEVVVCERRLPKGE